MASASAFPRRAGRTGAVLLLLLLGAATSRLAAQGPGTAAEDSVRALEAARRDALLRADTAALSRMVGSSGPGRTTWARSRAAPCG